MINIKRIIFNLLFIFFLPVFSFAFANDVKEIKIPAHEKYLNDLITTFAKSMKEELDLTYDDPPSDYTEQQRISMPDNIKEICIGFNANCKAKKEEARKLEVLVTEKFLETVNSNVNIRPYLKEYPFKRENVRVGLTFGFDDILNGGEFPDLEEELLKEELLYVVVKSKYTIFYWVYCPAAKFMVDFKVEPYDEAFKIVQNSH